MYNFYNDMISEKRPAWRNAYEIKIAAREHEKQRFHMINEVASWVEPRTPGQGDWQSGWMSILKVPLRLLAILIG